MSTSLPNLFFSRLLMLVTTAVALVLFGLVATAPLFDTGESPGASGGERLLFVFARDTTLRRTALASAVGLIVTACVFFRVPGGTKKSKSSRVPPPPDIAGA